MGRVWRRRLWFYGIWFVVCVTGSLILQRHISSPAPDLSRPPEESRRVIHPAGFSIVVPRNMKATIETPLFAGDVDAINILPDRGRSRYTPYMHVRRLSLEVTTEPDRPHVPGVFQGQPAVIFEGTSGEYYMWSALVERGKDQYEVRLSLPSFGDAIKPMPPPKWMPYLESFRVEDGSGTL